jgi:uncharacterized membrane protein YgcG
VRLRTLVLGVLASCLCFSAATPGADRSLYWKQIGVRARLDADGRLHVSERQTFVFDGAWNGGERRFRVALGQDLRLNRLARVDPESGQERLLVPGNLSRIDQYAWKDSNTLRWRSRLPSDPPFDHTPITYVIEYTLSGILWPREGAYLLNHDFAFPDRSGVIERFTLDFSLDPVWKGPAAMPQHLERLHLAPGQSVLVTAWLRYRGVGHPAAVRVPPPVEARDGLLAVLILGFALFFAAFYRRENKRGRFAPLVPIEQIDERWLASNVFDELPEVVGAAWDEATGAAEVAAVVARMVGEKKIRTEVARTGFWIFRKTELEMTLLVDRRDLSGYERELVDALFFAGDTTSTGQIRAHYRQSGFNPSKKIRPGIEQRIARRYPKERSDRPSWKPAAALVLAGAGLLVWAGLSRKGEFAFAALGAGIAAVSYVVTAAAAIAYRKRLTHLLSASIGFLIVPLLYAAGVAFLLRLGLPLVGLATLSGLTLLALALALSAFHLASTREGPEQIRWRKTLASARRYLAVQLRQARPKLEDAWMPYLLAFGLGPDVDRWFHSYGGAATSALGGFSAGSGDAGGGLSSGGWTGGGGFSGGAGASGAWAGALSGIASGVSSASSGGGGGGGGGGSSGGGGGGGW